MMSPSTTSNTISKGAMSARERRFNPRVRRNTIQKTTDARATISMALGPQGADEPQRRGLLGAGVGAQLARLLCEPTNRPGCHVPLHRERVAGGWVARQRP